MSTLSSTETMSEQCPFDDGVYDCVKKVIIGQDTQSIAYIIIQYVRNGDVVQLEHGSERGAQITEVLIYIFKISIKLVINFDYMCFSKRKKNFVYMCVFALTCCLFSVLLIFFL